MAAFVYNIFKGDVVSGTYIWANSLTSYIINATLVTGSYAPTASHVYASAFSGSELSSTSHAAGYAGSLRLSLVSTFISVNNTAIAGSAGRVEIGASATTWSGISAGCAAAVILLAESAGGANSNGNTRLIAYIDTGGFPILTNGGDLQITWASAGILQNT